MTPAISADSHIVEPREVFDSVAKVYGEHAPQIIKHPEWGDFVTAPGVTGRDQVVAGTSGVPVGRLGIAGRRLDDPATTEQMKQGYAGLPPGVLDPHKRIAHQDRDGVTA